MNYLHQTSRVAVVYCLDSLESVGLCEGGVRDGDSGIVPLDDDSERSKHADTAVLELSSSVESEGLSVLVLRQAKGVEEADRRSGAHKVDLHAERVLHAAAGGSEGRGGGEGSKEEGGADHGEV